MNDELELYREDRKLAKEDQSIIRKLSDERPTLVKSPLSVASQPVMVRPKEMMIAGRSRMVDPYELMRMIKNVTQTIGEYKSSDNAFGDVIVAAMRKARHDLVNTLESKFHIRWALDEEGRTTFYLE